MLFNNPFKPERIDSLLDELWLTDASKILDVGCGQGELLQNPGDNHIAEKVKRRRVWKNAYWQWGRNTMGFGLYVFLVDK